MKILPFILFVLIALMLNPTGRIFGSSTSPAMIRHMVVLKLKYAKGSAEEAAFLAAAAKLANIPGVVEFEILRQSSPKNKFHFGISMKFQTTQQYNQYSHHPDHVAFIEHYWKKDVADFMEIDLESL